MSQIRDALVDFNPWWKGSFSIEFKERAIFEQVKRFLDSRQIIAFTGLRRVGKTTLMFKIVSDFLKNGFDAKNILFFSFDEFKDINLRDLLREFESLVEKDLRAGGRFLLLFDEIQKLSDWENQIKVLYDLFGKTAKIFVSGSESLFIKKKSRETLAGRIFEFKIEPLLFKEFLSFKGIAFEPTSLYEKELLNLFNEFILTQGFPELVNVKEPEIIKKYVQESIVERVVYKDIQNLFNIQDVSVIDSLLKIFLNEPGQLVDISKLSKELGISRQTLSLYLHYLEESFLLRKLYNFSKNHRKTERKLKKYYPTIVSPSLLFKEDDLSKSKAFEWLLINQLKPEFFWRDPYKNEVDAIITNKETIPIEIKYGKIDTTGLLAFMKKFNTSKGYILTPNKEETQKNGGKTIQTIPAYKFLLQQTPEK